MCYCDFKKTKELLKYELYSLVIIKNKTFLKEFKKLNFLNKKLIFFFKLNFFKRIYKINLKKKIKK